MQTLSKKESEVVLKRNGIPTDTGDKSLLSKVGSKVGNYVKNSIVDQFKGGLQTAKEGFSAAGNSSGNPLTFGENVLKGLSGAAGAVTAPFAPIAKPVGYAVESMAGNKGPFGLANLPIVQKFSDTKAGAATARVAEDVSNAANVVGTVGGFMGGPKVAGKAAGAADTVAQGVQGFATKTAEDVRAMGSKVGTAMQGFSKGMIPTKAQIINSEIAKVFDLTPGDITKFFAKTQEDFGNFLVKNNLIGDSVDSSISRIRGFFDDNFKAVRSDIKKAVENGAQYPQLKIPGYTQALNEVISKIDGVAGLESQLRSAKALLNKVYPTLEDVQMVKEMLDNHFQLYNVIGDVASGANKLGLANIRGVLQRFLEDEVRQRVGTDIRQLNKNVSSAKSTLSMIAQRSTRELTRANLSLSDFGTFGGGAFLGGPATGIAAVFLKKMYQNPNLKLKFIRLLGKLDDTELAPITSDLENGVIPKQFEQFLKLPAKGQGSLGKLQMPSKIVTNEATTEGLTRIGGQGSRRLIRSENLQPGQISAPKVNLTPDIPKNILDTLKDLKAKYKNSSLSDEGGYVNFLGKAKEAQLEDTFDRLQTRKVQLLEQGYSETSPAVRNLIKQLKSISDQIYETR